MPTPKTLEFIKKHEGFKPKPYKDTKGKWTIGYGFTDPSLIAMKYMSKKQAQEILEKEVDKREKEVSRKFPKWDKYPEDAKTAMISYYYNYPAGFLNSSAFMMHMRYEDYPRAMKEIDAGMYDPESPGLKDRRLEEQKLFSSLIPKEKTYKDLPQITQLPISKFKSPFNPLPTHKVEPLRFPYSVESYSNRPLDAIMKFHNVKNLKTQHNWNEG